MRPVTLAGAVIGATVAAVLALSTGPLATAEAAPQSVSAAKPKPSPSPPPVDPTCNPNDPSCGVTVTGGDGSPPSGGGTGGGSGRGGSSNGKCTWDGQEVLCQNTLGYFNPTDGCYYQFVQPPDPSNRAWGTHYPNGNIYNLSCPFAPGGLNTGTVWLATPPPGSPGGLTGLQLAQIAAKRVRIPSPDFQRSPLKSNSDNGTPFTWVNLWTWFWTTPTSWKPRWATASAGGLSATVTVTPVALKITPGDGAGTISCPGPGRAWTSTDANNPPSSGGCGYRYQKVAAAPLTATMTIEWTVTWTATDGESGTLPNIETSSGSSFIVEQIQVVNR